MKIVRFIAGPVDANNYLVWDEQSKDAVLIDCSDYREDILNRISEENLNIKYILLTHGHFDHILGLNEMNDVLKAKVGVSRSDAILLDSVAQMCAYFGLPAAASQKYDFFADETAEDLFIGDIKIKVLKTPGHTEGGLSYLIDNCVFTGDTLFKGSYGRVDLPGGNFKTIKNSLENVLFALPEETKVYPGHGDFSNIEFEKKYNDINI